MLQQLRYLIQVENKVAAPRYKRTSEALLIDDALQLDNHELVAMITRLAGKQDFLRGLILNEM